MSDSEAGVVQRLKHRVLPRGRAVRKLPLGLARGCNMEIDFAHDTRLYLGLYEIELNHWIRELCGPGSRCLDIGAAWGYDSLAMGRLGAAEVIAFEVEAEAAAMTRRNLAANPQLRANFTVEEAYVSDRTGDGEVAIDDYIRERGDFAPDFVKMDIEGAELNALQGMPDLLENGRPDLLIEIHGEQVETDCAVLLREKGYDLTIVNPRRLLRDHRPIAHNRWLIARG
jgi:hypothetical protein